MRAPLLLPLLLLGVSSQDTSSSPAPGENGKIATTAAVTTTIKTKNPSSTSAMPAVTVQATTLAENPSTTTVVSPTTFQMITTAKPPTTSVTSSATIEGPAPSNNPGNPPSIPTTSPHQSQQDSSSVSSGGSPATPPVTSGTAQQKTSPAGSLGGLPATTTASPILTHVSSSSATTGGSGTGVASSPSVEAQGSQPVDQLASTTASTGVPMSNLPPAQKDYGVSSPSSVSKQPHSSSSSPVLGLASSTTPGSTGTSVTALAGPVSHTTSNASLSLPPENTDKFSKAITTPTSGGDQRSPEAGSVPTKPSIADQSPTSEQPLTPGLGDQPECSTCGHHHPNTSLQNEVICKDQVQNSLPNMYLKEPRTCAMWRTASSNNSFFESFCSTGQHTFNASREACTVMLTSHEHHSHHWAVQTILHIRLDPEKVLEDLKEKEKLEELGIANITYDKREQEMIINDEFSTPLIITIVTLAGSLLLIAAIYGCCHQRFSQKKDQRLTEELQTMENGYHDNPTLEVMETSSEMQEKKVNLNGELGDSWIVPLDTLMKEDLEEEEDTHL
ncbi:podocalyxin isoform X4 [Melanerpes formicivorus]|uniref:podocalyxin isoform X4 n=1 Tax=Melanerpes formicivorus TaxID=211600 RepID=UPI00358F9FEE